LRFCLLEKGTQCRKLNSFNKLLLLDYLQLRIAFLQLRGCSRAKHEMGGHRVQMGGPGTTGPPLATAMAVVCFIMCKFPHPYFKIEGTKHTV